MRRLALVAVALAALFVADGAGAQRPAGSEAAARGDLAQARAEWTAAAQAGDLRAQHRLGLAWLQGLGGPRDAAEGQRWLAAAAEKGFAPARLDLALSLLSPPAGARPDYARAAALLKAAAQQGDARAQYEYGYLLHKGQGVRLDFEDAVEWYGKAAEQGLPAAFGKLGYMHAQGYGVRKDDAAALEWWRKGAAAGDPESQYSLARRLLPEDAPGRDEAQALDLLLRAAEQGYGPAQQAYAAMRLDGLGGQPADRAEGLYWLRRAAAQDQPEAQAMLARALLATGQRADLFEAFDWLRQALKSRHQAAQALVAELARRVPAPDELMANPKPDAAAAIVYCMLAFLAEDAWAEIPKRCQSFAERSLPIAQYMMGWSAERGHGQPADPRAAARWYALASQQDEARAQNALGRMLIRGIGFAPDPARGLALVQRAAALGYAPAQFNLGFLYESGVGAAKDESAAAQWYARAAVQGHARAQLNLAVMLTDGRGVARDPAQAFVWALLAATPQGVDQEERVAAGAAEPLQARLRAALTPAQTAEAEALAKTFRTRDG